MASRKAVEVTFTATVEPGTYWPESVKEEVERVSSGPDDLLYLEEYIVSMCEKVHGLKVLWTQGRVVAVDDDSGYDHESTPNAEEAQA